MVEMRSLSISSGTEFARFLCERQCRWWGLQGSDGRLVISWVVTLGRALCFGLTTWAMVNGVGPPAPPNQRIIHVNHCFLYF